MNILLVALNAKYIHSNPAIYSLAACAKDYVDDGNTVNIAEFTINDRYEDILNGILLRKPDIIGFSVYIWNSQEMKELMEDIHKIKPEIMLFAGGPEATNNPETFIKWCDFVMLGEGETNFKIITKCVVNHQQIPFEDMEGIAYATYRKPGEKYMVVHPQGSKSMVDMDTIPFLYDELDNFENRIIYYESSRGCPFRCSYCLSSIEKSVRYRSMEVVFRELKYFLDKKVKQVKFIDRTFNSSSKRSLKIWKFIKDNDNGVTNFHFEIGADLLSKEEIDLLKTLRTGLVQLEIGIQSTNEDTMRMIHRTANNKKLMENVMELRKNYNINLHTDLIAGLPYEGYESFKQSFNDIYPLYADQLQLGFLKVLKGTEMYERSQEYGLVYSSKQPYEVFYSKWLSYEENAHLHRVCDGVELFYNAQLFRHSLKYLEQFFDTYFDMYDALADYLDSNKLSGVGISAKRKFEILKDFGKNYCSQDKLDYFLSYLRLDEMLHMHPNRKMSAVESFTFPEGKRVYEFDYTKKSPVTGEVEFKEV